MFVLVECQFHRARFTSLCKMFAIVESQFHRARFCFTFLSSGRSRCCCPRSKAIACLACCMVSPSWLWVWTTWPTNSSRCFMHSLLSMRGSSSKATHATTSCHTKGKLRSHDKTGKHQRRKTCPNSAMANAVIIALVHLPAGLRAFQPLVYL